MNSQLTSARRRRAALAHLDEQIQEHMATEQLPTIRCEPRSNILACARLSDYDRPMRGPLDIYQQCISDASLPPSFSHDRGDVRQFRPVT